MLNPFDYIHITKKVRNMEIWKDIIGYEGFYQISSYGNVRNTKTGQTLTGDVNNIGYRRVFLYAPVRKRFFVHRLVAEHFCDGYAEGLVVNHIDGNKMNNNYQNLEWVTRSENDLHAFRLNLRKSYPCAFKRRVVSFDLATGDIIKVYENTQECCDDLNVARSNIYACCKGTQKSCRGVGIRYE